MSDDRSETAPKRLAILPWGDLIEDYLDPVGLTLDEMCRDMTGGWLFGTVEALQRVGVECVLFVITARLEQARSLRHEPTGMLVRALPCRPAYRGLRRFVSNPYGRSGTEMFGVSRRWKVTVAELIWPLVPPTSIPRSARWAAICGARGAPPSCARTTNTPASTLPSSWARAWVFRSSPPFRAETARTTGSKGRCAGALSSGRVA